MLSMWILVYCLLHCEVKTTLAFKRQEHPEYMLFEKLFNDNVNKYNPNVRPTLDCDKPITVNVSVNLVTLHSLIERSQTLRTTVWIDLEWTDLQMTWNRSLFANIDSIVVPQEKIWIPDICISNEVTNNKCLIKSENGKSLIDYTGKVTLWWNREVQTGCDVDISRYPFDSQVCPIRIGTWYSEDEKVKLTPKFDNIDFSNYVLSEEWDIVSSSIKTVLVENDKHFTELEFFIVMDRKPLFYLYSIVLPILLLSVLNMVCFLVPIESGEKIDMTMAIFLTFAVFMTLISSTVPRTSEDVFKFGIFMTMHLMMSGITILLEVLVSHIYFKPKGTKMNKVYTWVYNHFVSNGKNDSVKPSSLRVHEHETMMDFGFETDPWQRLAIELDKMFGYIVTIINVLLILLFFVTVNIE
ncbi:acetylcholine receptor subunit beta-type unc-29-like [Saccostrea cucullata]|uniref:acetylcholine receptor subunit beta-type unc-29-like n=1 Tax=Saccostrea cuccullata TaxID=36930 RepID=UPI002ED32B99